LIGIAAGFALLLLAMPLGQKYADIYLNIVTVMDMEKYVVLMERAIGSFKIIGVLISALSGLAYIFADKGR
jgi:hypothetical protein